MDHYLKRAALATAAVVVVNPLIASIFWMLFFLVACRSATPNCAAIEQNLEYGLKLFWVLISGATGGYVATKKGENVAMALLATFVMVEIFGRIASLLLGLQVVEVPIWYTLAFYATTAFGLAIGSWIKMRALNVPS